MSITRPRPTLTATSRPYWEGAREGVLRLPVCDACGHTWFPPGRWCPACLSPEVSWRPASGRGTLWSWNVFHRAYFSVMRDEVPYLTVLVRLEEGPFLTSTVVGAEVSELRCDLPLVVEFQQIDDELTIPVFRIAQKKSPAVRRPVKRTSTASSTKEAGDRAV